MRIPRPSFSPWLVLLTLVAAGAAAAAGYGLTAPKRYSATAQLLVSPVPGADTTFAGLDVLRDTAGRRTAAESAAVLLRSPQVADAVRTQLGLHISQAAVLDELDTHVVDGSSVVDVTVSDASATAAAQLANAFVDALIASRTTNFQSQLASVIRQDTQMLASGGRGPQASEVARRLAVLRGLLGQPDPTLRRATTATAPGSASSPGLATLIGIGAASGLGAGALVLLVLALWRRRDAGMPEAYSSAPMSDNAVEALVERLEQRLAARESALAARERDLQARITELRALGDTREASDAERALLARERALEERVAAVTERERAVARAAAAPAPRADTAEVERRERELAERERALEERVTAVTQRELALARAAAHALPAPASAPAVAPAPAGNGSGAFNLAALERLVAEGAVEHPERREEWESYLFFLRDYAGADGSLPPRVDGLVEETFGDLL
jgi:capsular polysaccharide biosynthesis protein